MPEDTYGGIDLQPAISYPFIADRYAVTGWCATYANNRLYS